MTTQTTLALVEIGRPLTKITLPVPETLNENEVLIKITAAGIAPLDRKLRDLNIFNIGSRVPAVITGDLVGTVVKNGSNMSFPIGAHVFSQTLFNNPLGGGLQEYVVINGIYTAIVPPGISDTEAALYPINAMTTALALFSKQGLGIPFPGTPESANFDAKNEKIVIIGGGSNIGKLAVQFARLAGIGKIVTTASLESSSELKRLGATHVVDRQAPDVEDQIRRIVGDDLLYVYDTVNAADHTLGVSFLSNKKRGTFAFNLTGKPDEEILAKKAAGVEWKHIQGFSHAIPEFGQMFWKEFPRWLETGKIKSPEYKVIEGLDADKVNAALDEYRDGKGGVRYHVRIE